MTSFSVCVLLLCCSIYLTTGEVTPITHVTPQHVHLSYGGTFQQMVVTWTTFKGTDSMVEFGKNKLSIVVKGSVTVFNSQSRTWYIHRVTLDGLLPGVKYYYHCGSDLGWSDLFHFTNCRSDPHWVPKMAAFGDLGSVNAQSLPRLKQEVAMETIDVILHVGDFAYDLDSIQGHVGDSFMQQIQPIAAYTPYMTTVGNHESSGNFSHYKQRFSMPGGTEGMFYSYNLGLAHIISINTEAYYYPQYGSDQILTQYNWLNKDLQKANLPTNRARYPWIIVLGHRPMYCAVIAPLPLPHKNDCDSVRDKGSETEPYKNPRAPVHVISGSAGCYERHDIFAPKPEWVDKNILDYGYTKIQALNYTHLYMEQISDDQHGAVVDRLYIEQRYPRQHFTCHLDPKPHRVSRGSTGL